MLEGEVACELAELKIAAKNKLNDRIGSSDEENHDYGPINTNKTKDDKELKGDKVASNIVGILVEKNNTEKFKSDVEKNTDFLSSKNESKTQDENIENGNVAINGPEEVGKKKEIASSKEEVKIGNKNIETGMETEDMDKKSNIAPRNEGKKQDINIENGPKSDHFEKRMNIDNSGDECDITDKNTEVIMETGQMELEPEIVSSMVESKMHDKNTDENKEENKMKTDTITKITEVAISKDEGKIIETNNGDISQDNVAKEEILTNNTSESNKDVYKADKEEIKKESEKVFSKTDDSSVMYGNIAEGKNEANEEIPKEDCKSEGVLKPFKIPKKAEFASKVDMKTDKIREEHKSKEEHKLKGEHKLKTDNVEKKTEFISKGDKLKEKMKEEMERRKEKKDRSKKHRSEGGWLLAPTDKHDKHKRDRDKHDKHGRDSQHKHHKQGRDREDRHEKHGRNREDKHDKHERDTDDRHDKHKRSREHRHDKHRQDRENRHQQHESETEDGFDSCEGEIEQDRHVDLLQTGLPKETREAWQHFNITDWHPPKAAPSKTMYPPTSELLGDTPMEDTTWVEPKTFYPTLEEFANLTKYVKYMASQGADRAGIAKIVAPKEWRPRKIGYNPADMEHIEIKPVQQDISLHKEVAGAFTTLADRSRPEISVDGYRRLAISAKYCTPAHNSYEELEQQYWKENMDDKSAAPIYGADTLTSITDDDEKVTNIPKLDSLLNNLMKEKIPGVNLPYVYFGMWKATFSWHVEDMDLCAINYIHYGAPKTWYCIPPQFGYKLEQVAQKLFPDFAESCFNLLRHKAIMIGPKLLEANGVRVQKMVQEQRNMIVVFPHAYHSGFNHGFNMAESCNFATKEWVEHGKRFRDCVCRDQESEVKIQMEPFVKVVQPEKYRAWMNGKDFALHPEDPWYIRRCLQDAICRLKRNEIDFHEFEKLKKELKRKRQIPKWFKGRFVIDYTDERKITTDLSSDTEEEVASLPSPRVRAAKRKLEERLEAGKSGFKLKIKKMRKSKCVRKKLEMDNYTKMLEDEIAAIEERKTKIAELHAEGNFGRGQAKGVGFAGADEQHLLEQKANVTCTAKKNHRFKSCLKCTGCRTPNCGDCIHCLDMPKFGGMGTMKQKCMMRICVNPQLRTCDKCVWNL